MTTYTKTHTNKKKTHIQENRQQKAGAQTKKQEHTNENKNNADKEIHTKKELIVVSEAQANTKENSKQTKTIIAETNN